MKSIVIIVGHPGAESLCRTLAADYQKGAEGAGGRVEVLDLSQMTFHSDLENGQKGDQPLEPDLQRAQKTLAAADHLVFVHPNWWGTYPARLKGFLDRVLLPGFAFQYRDGGNLVDQLWKGKTARLVVTMDGPGWWYQWAMGGGGDRALRKSTLEFCGVRVLGTYHADLLRPRKSAPVARHRQRVEAWGRRDAG